MLHEAPKFPGRQDQFAHPVVRLYLRDLSIRRDQLPLVFCSQVIKERLEKLIQDEAAELRRQPQNLGNNQLYELEVMHDICAKAFEYNVIIKGPRRS